MCDRAACPPEVVIRRRPSLLGMMLQLVFAYVLLVVGGGTLINTGQPVAVEVGQLLKTVTFVEPSISWAESHGYGHLSAGLRMLAGGLPIGPLSSSI